MAAIIFYYFLYFLFFQFSINIHLHANSYLHELYRKTNCKSISSFIDWHLFLIVRRPCFLVGQLNVRHPRQSILIQNNTFRYHLKCECLSQQRKKYLLFHFNIYSRMSSMYIYIISLMYTVYPFLLCFYQKYICKMRILIRTF